MIRDKDGKLAITPGVWELSLTGCNLIRPEVKIPHYTGAASWRAEQDHKTQRRANAALIAEAGTVTNATGRTPAELRDLVRELWEACDKCAAYLRDENHDEWAEWLELTLTKSEGV
jgi:hypothetical protein